MCMLFPQPYLDDKFIHLTKESQKLSMHMFFEKKYVSHVESKQEHQKLYHVLELESVFTENSEIGKKIEQRK